MPTNKGIAILYCDTVEEEKEEILEREQNTDFSWLGYYDNIQDIYDDMDIQGFTEKQVDQLTHNRYGNVLDIIEYNSSYTVYIGSR